MIVTKNYLRFVRFRLNNLHSPGYNLTDLVCALLLKRDLCALHCSGFKLGDRVVAVLAPPNTGKTLTTMRMVLDHGASFISEDLAITDGEHIFACPWTSTFRYYDELTRGGPLAMRMKLIKVLPIMELIPFPGSKKLIDTYIGKDRIEESARVTDIVILARRKGGVEVLEKDEALKLTWNLNCYEFFYRKSPMLTAYSYFNPAFDPEALVEKEKEILSRLVSQSRCMLVKSEDAVDFAKLVMDKIG
jgi:hypothetical protein